jgi:hypothetical protein
MFSGSVCMTQNQFVIKFSGFLHTSMLGGGGFFSICSWFWVTMLFNLGDLSSASLGPLALFCMELAWGEH